MTWIRLYSGAPPESAFGQIQGQGTPLVIDTTTGVVYYNQDGAPTALFALKGNVFGPDGALDTSVALFDTSTGKLLRDCLITVSADNAIRSATNSGANAVAVPLYNWIEQTADRTLTSTVNAQKIFNTTTNGALTLPTGQYCFRSLVYITGMLATAGNAAFSPLGAGTAVCDRFELHASGMDNTTPLIAGTQTGSISVTSSTPVSALTAGTGTGMAMSITGSFRITTAGTIIPSVSLVSAVAATLKAGTKFAIWKIGESSEDYLGAWS